MQRRLKHGRTLRLDPGSLSAAMNRCGMSVEELAYATDTSTGSVNNWLSGKPAYRSTAQRIADTLQTSLVSLLEPTIQLASARSIHEYLLAEVLSDWRTMSNGLRYQICRLRHSELDRQARAKRFDLRELPTDVAQIHESRIKRHPKVCDSFREHANLIRNLTAFRDPVDPFFWVIDEWIDGRTLHEHLSDRDRESGKERDMLLDIASGLEALHGRGIIRRELGPDNIIVREDSRCVLTEFELSKLGEQVPTVINGEWPVDKYRAPEVATGDVDVRADIYSLCRIAMHILLGFLPEACSGIANLGKLEIPKGLRESLSNGLSILRDERPGCINEVIVQLKQWGP